ncbi:MAG: HD domain-containing protein [Planctomycetes bacterium]|nr:HD domain-containing protein [Planctomycetota bacterium]MCH9726555.1 HD domain-containing protein [Planctomycetota bacterium]MCH9779224.1 HD domain-containing protein [Planctomycetota bacterium]MDF1743331.1 HD domain-containing protein [Gimesia sp.]
MEILHSPVVEHAIRLAAVAHKSQKRKSSGVPYIAHPMSVCLILMKAGFHDDTILAAAVLHDVVEDTDLTIEQLTEEFSDEVIQYVKEMTEEKETSQGEKRSWHDRKQDHIEVMQQATLGARAIELADKLHNLEAMLFDLQTEDKHDFWGHFGASSEEIVQYYQSMIEAAGQSDQQLELLVNNCNARLTELKKYLS